jgi:hypothetical protein
MAFRNWVGRTYENGEAARHHADAFAGWLITGLAPLIPRTGVGGTLLERALEGRSLLPACFRETYARIERQKSEVPMLTDVMTLSLCLWAGALQLEDEFSLDKLGSLTEMAEEALIVATELKSKTSGPHMEAVVNGLSRELSAVALASLLAAYRSSKKAQAVGPELESRMQKLVEDGLELFGKGEPDHANAPDLTSIKLIGEIDALLSLCAIVWIRFGLDRLRDFAYLRRLQFNFICRNIAPDDHGRAQPLLEPVSLALAGRGSTGILSNCSVASCFRAANDLSTRYLNRAALIALDGSFDSGFQNDMAIMVIYHGHALQINLERPLTILLEQDSDEKTVLRKFLFRLPGNLIFSYALMFLNASSKLRGQSDAAKVEETVAEAANLIPVDSERTEVLSLLQLHKLEGHAHRGDSLPPEDEILTAWWDRRESWMFAVVMRIVIQNGHPRDEDWKIAHSLLGHDPLQDETTSQFLLAMALAKHSDENKLTPQQRAALISYLARSLTKWEEQMLVEINVMAYHLLAQLDRPHWHIYEAALMKWQKIKIERDHLERLPEFGQQKKYYLIFYEYYDSAHFWDLPDDGSKEQWREFWRADTSKRKRFMQAWIDDGAEVPAPLLGAHGSIVSATFLWIGYRLFSPPFYDDPTYEDHRKHFNKAAKDALPAMIEAILLLPKMPGEIRALLAYYSKQVLSYAGLEDERSKQVAHRGAGVYPPRSFAGNHS